MMKKTFRMLLLSMLVCIVCLGIMIAALLYSNKQIVRFTPPPFEIQAVSGVPALTEEDGYKPIDAGVYKFSLCGDLYLTNGATDVWLTNPAENTAWLKAVLQDEEGNVLGETGIIRQGEYVQSISLTSVPADSVKVKLIIMGYEPENYYSVGNVSLYTSIHVPPAGSENTPQTA